MYSWEKDIKETDKRWIHCEKQMPDEGARVLASDVFEKIFILTRYHYSDGWELGTSERGRNVMKLREVLEADWNIGYICIMSRDEKLNFIHEYRFGSTAEYGYSEIGIENRMKKITIVKEPINAREYPGRYKCTWGVLTEKIPKNLLESEILWMQFGDMHLNNNRYETLRADVKACTIIPEGQQAVMDLEDEE